MTKYCMENGYSPSRIVRMDPTFQNATTVHHLDANGDGKQHELPMNGVLIRSMIKVMQRSMLLRKFCKGICLGFLELFRSGKILLKEFH